MKFIYLSIKQNVSWDFVGGAVRISLATGPGPRNHHSFSALQNHLEILYSSESNLALHYASGILDHWYHIFFSKSDASEDIHQQHVSNSHRKVIP